MMNELLTNDNSMNALADGQGGDRGPSKAKKRAKLVYGRRR
jgi:hypothetical protein